MQWEKRITITKNVLKYIDIITAKAVFFARKNRFYSVMTDLDNIFLMDKYRMDYFLPII